MSLQSFVRHWLNDRLPSELIADLADIAEDDCYSTEKRCHQIVWQALKYGLENERKMAKAELVVKIKYDFQEVKEALRKEREWYREAFEKIECAIENLIDYDIHEQRDALEACRDRLRALEEELSGNSGQLENET